MAHFRLIDAAQLETRLSSTAASPSSEVEALGIKTFVSGLASLLSADCLNILLWGASEPLRFVQRTRSGSDTPDDYRFARHRQWSALAPVVQAQHSELEAAELAQLYSRALAIAGYSVELLSSDALWQQLVGPRVALRPTLRTNKRITPESFLPDSVELATVQVAAICGDASRGVDGLPGVSATRARQLLRSFGGLPQLLAVAGSLRGITDHPKWATQLNLPATQALVKRNHELLDLSRHSPSPPAVLTIGEYDFLSGIDLCDELGFTDWLADFPKAIAGFSRRIDTGAVRTFTRLTGLEG